MAATYEPIASTTLGSSAADITFSGIAALWTDLVVVLIGEADGNGWMPAIQFNSDTGTNYSRTYVDGNGTSAASGRSSSAAYIAASTGNPTNQQHINITHVMSYANTNVYKTTLSEQAAPGVAVARVVGLWRSTAAVTSIKLLPAFSVNFKAGTTASLFGIKASA